ERVGPPARLAPRRQLQADAFEHRDHRRPLAEPDGWRQIVTHAGVETADERAEPRIAAQPARELAADPTEVAGYGLRAHAGRASHRGHRSRPTAGAQQGRALAGEVDPDRAVRAAERDAELPRHGRERHVDRAQPSLALEHGGELGRLAAGLA